MARVPYADPDDLPAEHRHLLESSLQHGKRLNLYRALGAFPTALVGVRSFLGVLWNDIGLTDRQRELVILAAAREQESVYEWDQHVRIGLDVGLTRAEVRAIADEREDEFGDDEAALVRYAAAVAGARVGDEVYDTFASTVDDETVVAVTTLAAGYVMVARVLDALDVELEGEFVGWDTEQAPEA